MRNTNERLRIQCQLRVCASIQSADAFSRDRHLAQSSKSWSASRPQSKSPSATTALHFRQKCLSAIVVLLKAACKPAVHYGSLSALVMDGVNLNGRRRLTIPPPGTPPP